MRPPRKVIIPNMPDLEKDLNFMLEDIYTLTMHDTPAERDAWNALTTDAERITFLARKLGLV